MTIRALAAALLLLGTAGCSWLIGVSDDPVVTGEILDAAGESSPEASEDDAGLNAPDDAEVE